MITQTRHEFLINQYRYNQSMPIYVWLCFAILREGDDRRNDVCYIFLCLAKDHTHLLQRLLRPS